MTNQRNSCSSNIGVNILAPWTVLNSLLEVQASVFEFLPNFLSCEMKISRDLLYSTLANCWEGRFHVMCYCFFLSHNKSVLIWALKSFLARFGHKKPLQPGKPRQERMLAMEGSTALPCTALSDGKIEFSQEAYKAKTRLHCWWTYLVPWDLSS